MANRITLRHGSTAPSASNLLPYELGWNQNNLGLYIGQPSGEPLLISSGGSKGTVTSITLKAGTGISLDTDNTAITTSGTRTITNSGVRATTINGNYLRVNTNGTNADLTIPYATSAGSATSATTASKLGSSNVGAADRPIYLSSGTATQTTYRMAGTNAAATTALSVDTDLDTGIWYVSGTNGIYNQFDGVIYANKYNDSWISEIYQDYRTGQLAIRGKNNGTWQSWRKILDSSNWSSFITLYEENIQWGPTTVSKAGSVSPIGMSLSSEHSANRLAFINGDALTFEYSSDGGTTYTNYNYTNTNKTAFCTTSYAIPIGRVSGNYTTSSRTRMTLTAQNGTTGYVYTNPKKLLINISSSGGMQVLIEYRTGTNYQNNGNWVTFGTYNLSGWSGWNDIPLILGNLGGGTNQTSNNWQLRLTFIMTSVNSSYPTTASVNSIRLFGENGWSTPSTMAATGHLYSYDSLQNAIFPAQITATAFNGNAATATSATTASKLANTTKIGDTNQPVYFTASGVPAAISYTIAKSVPSNAVFTDTWNALSTSQAGYVAQAPNDTGKFLRGDATWAAVTATNVGLGNVSNNANLNSTTGAKGDIIYWSAANTPAHLTNTSSTTKKFLSITSQVPSWTTLSNSDVGLGNVENTKLSTWTGSTAITTLGTIATGSIPLNNITSADDLKAIEALTGTTGLLKKTAANTWTLDTTAYTSNTGTVTKVTAGTGLSIGTTAGGNFTTTGTINHTNSVTAQTTQALYPIKIDACGHITAYGTAVTSLPASDVYDWAKASTKPSYTANEVGLGSVSNNAKLNSATGEKGDIIYWSAANTPVRLTIASSTTKKFLSVTSQALSWVTLANSDVGLGNVENKSSATIRGELTSSNVTTALGFTPYNATNPDGYTTNTGTVTSVQVQATSPLASSTNTAQTSTLNTTISLSNCTPNYVLAGPSSGTTAAAPSYRALVAADIPNHSTDKLNSGTLGVARGGTGASSFTADCAIISGSTTTSPLTTRGINNKTAAAAATTTNGNYLITNNTLYYALPKINNAKTYTSNSSFYAPTAGGTSGYVLVGAGTTSAPTWSQTVAIANGGTGATTVDAARTNLQIKYGTTAPNSAGLVNGDIYFYIQ